MADFFDTASAFVATSIAALRRNRPALSKALSGLLGDMRRAHVEEAQSVIMNVRDGTAALTIALGEQLDGLRLRSDVASSVGLELSMALAASALLGSAAQSRLGETHEAIATLDAALLRSRSSKHTSLLQQAVGVLESIGIDSSGPTQCKRQRTAASGWPTPQGCSESPLAAFGSQMRKVCARSSGSQGSDPRVEALIRGASEPLVLTGLASSWPAIRRWAEPKYLHDVAGHRVVPIEIGAAHLEVGGSEEGVGEQQVLRTLGEFIDEVVLGDRAANEAEGEATTLAPTAISATVPVTAAGTRGYLAQHQLFEQIPALAADLGHPPGVPSDADRRAWFGPAHVATPVHFDHHHGLLVQIVGRKRVLLWPPDARQRLRAPAPDAPLANTASFDPTAFEKLVRNNVGESVPAALEARGGPSDDDVAQLRATCVSVELEPGGAVLIPRGWWHYVTSLSVSFSVSYWW